MSKLINFRILFIGLSILMLSAVAFGFAAANVVPESGAGDGAGDISGYTISNITYTLLSTDPTKLDELQLDVAATAGADAPASVLITVDSGTTWITCTGPATNTWTCTFGVGSEPSVTATSSLQVVAAQ